MLWQGLGTFERQVGRGTAVLGTFARQGGPGPALLGTFERQVGPGPAVLGTFERQDGPGPAVLGTLERQVAPGPAVSDESSVSGTRRKGYNDKTSFSNSSSIRRLLQIFCIDILLVFFEKRVVTPLLL